MYLLYLCMCSYACLCGCVCIYIAAYGPVHSTVHMCVCALSVSCVLSVYLPSLSCPSSTCHPSSSHPIFLPSVTHLPPICLPSVHCLMLTSHRPDAMPFHHPDSMFLSSVSCHLVGALLVQFLSGALGINGESHLRQFKRCY